MSTQQIIALLIIIAIIVIVNLAVQLLWYLLPAIVLFLLGYLAYKKLFNKP